MGTLDDQMGERRESVDPIGARSDTPDRFATRFCSSM